MKLQVRLRSVADSTTESIARRPPVGALIHGDATAVWLQTVSEWQLPTGDLRFLPLTYPPDRVFAVLVIGDAIATLGQRLQTSLRMRLPLLFYQSRAERLFYPVDAELTPEVSTTELTHLLPPGSDQLLVWHPSTGLMQFESDQILTAVDLLTGPVPGNHCWNGARFGPVVNDKIRSLQSSLSPEDLIAVMQQGNQDIGQDAGDIGSAPKAPDEIPMPLLNDMLRTLKRLAAQAVFQVTNRLPDHPDGSHAMRRLHEWAMNALNTTASMASADAGQACGKQTADTKSQATTASVISTRRENELKRLLHMLENDPDTGLRYALPLDGSRSRGQTPPSSQLGEHIPEFHLNQLGRGGPADTWDVPWQYQRRLRQSYQELAQRAMRLGNFRRAAYIHATLLHDLQSAAIALEAGRFFQDAAAIYLSRLNQPLRAAACLKQGGMWEEAVAIFREHQQWMEAGELFEQLNQPNDAKEMFHLEVALREQRRQFRTGAEIADQKLGDVDLAVRLLLAGWEDRTRSEDCLRQLLKMLGRRGRHQQAASVIDQLCTDSVFAGHRVAAVTVISDTANDYPDEAVREQACRLTWTLAAAMLSDPLCMHHSVALQAVRKLAEEDELLHRDTTRFAMQRSERTAAAGRAMQSTAQEYQQQASERVRAAGGIQSTGGILLNTADLPERIDWKSGVATSRAIFCLGLTVTDSLVVVRCPWPSRDRMETFAGDTRRFRPNELVPLDSCQLRENPQQADRVYLQQVPGHRRWNMVAREIVRPDSTFIDVLPPFADLLLDVRMQSAGTGWAISLSNDDGAYRLLALSAAGILHSVLVRGIQFEDNADGLPGLRMHLCRDRIILVSPHSVYSVTLPREEFLDRAGSQALEAELLLTAWGGSGISSVAVSAIDTTPRIVLSMPLGATAIWPGSHEHCQFAQELIEPLVICTGNGTFVAACQTTGRIEAYRLYRGTARLYRGTARLRAEHTEEPQLGQIKCLFPGHTPAEYLVLKDSGHLHRHLIK